MNMILNTTAHAAAGIVKIHKAPNLIYCLEDTIEQKRVVAHSL